MLQIILLLLPGILSNEWKVTYPELSICAVRGSNVSIPCNFTYPENKQLQVTEMSWCQNTTHGNCDINGSYVYNSTNQTNEKNFHYTGDKTSNCSLLISNINSTRSEQYLFRFKTNLTGGNYTGPHGVYVTVTDLNVSMTRLGDNETIRAGESLNLTCTVSCPGHLPKLQWFKNNEPIQESDPVLTFINVTPQDSGNYSCSLRNFKSEQISLYVEGTSGAVSDTSGAVSDTSGAVSDTSGPLPFFWIIIIGVSLASIIFIVVCVILITRRAKVKNKQTAKEKGETQRSEDVHEEELQYASVSIRPKELSANTEQRNDDSTIYSAVRTKIKQKCEQTKCNPDTASDYLEAHFKSFCVNVTFCGKIKWKFNKVLYG